MGPRLWDRPFGILGQTVWHIGGNFSRHPPCEQRGGKSSFQTILAEKPSTRDTGEKSTQMAEPRDSGLAGKDAI